MAHFFSCSFAGHCEPDPDGIYTAEECQDACRPSELPPDLNYIQEAYNPRPWYELAPQDRRGVVKEMLGRNVTAAEATAFLRAWQQENYAFLLAHYPEFTIRNVTTPEMYEYLRTWYNSFYQLYGNKKATFLAIPELPEAQDFRAFIYDLYETRYDGQPWLGILQWHNKLQATPIPLEIIIGWIAADSDDRVPSGVRSIFYSAIQNLTDVKILRFIYDPRVIKSIEMVITILRNRPSLRQQVVNDTLDRGREKYGERWERLLEAMWEEYDIVPE